LGLDDRPLSSALVNTACWTELNLLLADKNPTNQLYAVQRLSKMTAACREGADQSNDFDRPAVWTALAPFLTNESDPTVTAAIHSFHVGPDCGKGQNSHGLHLPSACMVPMCQVRNARFRLSAQLSPLMLQPER
jgi:hypothetical protein